MAAAFLFADNARSTVAVGIGVSATTIQVAPGTGALFPSPGANQQFALTLNDNATRQIYEVVYCTARSGDVLTVIRGQEGTAALSWVIGDYCWNGPTAGQMNALVQIPHMTDASIAPIFANTQVHGTFGVTGASALAGLTNTGGLQNNGNIVGTGNITAAGIVQGGTVNSTGAITAAANVTAGQILIANVDVWAARNVGAGQDITATRNVQAFNGLVSAATDIYAGHGVYGLTATITQTMQAGTVVSVGNIQANGNVNANVQVSSPYIISYGDIQANRNINASGTTSGGYVFSYGDVHANNSLTAGLDIGAVRYITAGDSIQANVNINANSQLSGGYIVSWGDIHANSTVTAATDIGAGRNLSAASGVYAPNFYASQAITAQTDIFSGHNCTVQYDFYAGHSMATLGTCYVGQGLTVDGYGLALNMPHGGAVISGDLNLAGAFWVGPSWQLAGMYVDGAGNTNINLDANIPFSLQWKSSTYELIYWWGGLALMHMDAAGNMAIYGRLFQGNPSDERVKKGVEPFQRGLADLIKLSPVRYQYNGLGGTLDDGRVFYGVTAQDAVKAVPECVSETVDLHHEEWAVPEERQRLPGQLVVDDQPLLYAIINALKEIDQRLTRLEARA
jgi:hypothetical protein